MLRILVAQIDASLIEERRADLSTVYREDRTNPGRAGKVLKERSEIPPLKSINVFQLVADEPFAKYLP